MPKRLTNAHLERALDAAITMLMDEHDCPPIGYANCRANVEQDAILLTEPERGKSCPACWRDHLLKESETACSQP